MESINEHDWPRVAARYAKRAHSQRLVVRGRVRYLRRFDATCVTDPFPKSGGEKIRNLPLAEFRTALEERGIAELAHAYHPDPEGAFAMLIDGSRSDVILAILLARVRSGTECDGDRPPE